MIDIGLEKLAYQLGELLKKKAKKIAVAESCTGGGLAFVMTDIPGSSLWFDRGFVTYSNLAKVQMLQVNQKTLDKYGAVSEEVALEMVQGTLKNSEADIVISITGIAGPTGGSELKPVGTVYIAVGTSENETNCNQLFFSGNRKLVRRRSIYYALQKCLEQISKYSA